MDLMPIPFGYKTQLMKNQNRFHQQIIQLDIKPRVTEIRQFRKINAIKKFSKEQTTIYKQKFYTSINDSQQSYKKNQSLDLLNSSFDYNHSSYRTLDDEVSHSNFNNILSSKNSSPQASTIAKKLNSNIRKNNTNLIQNNYGQKTIQKICNQQSVNYYQLQYLNQNDITMTDVKKTIKQRKSTTAEVLEPVADTALKKNNNDCRISNIQLDINSSTNQDIDFKNKQQIYNFLNAIYQPIIEKNIRNRMHKAKPDRIVLKESIIDKLQKQKVDVSPKAFLSNNRQLIQSQHQHQIRDEDNNFNNQSDHEYNHFKSFNENNRTLKHQLQNNNPQQQQPQLICYHNGVKINLPKNKFLVKYLQNKSATQQQYLKQLHLNRQIILEKDQGDIQKNNTNNNFDNNMIAYKTPQNNQTFKVQQPIKKYSPDLQQNQEEKHYKNLQQYYIQKYEVKLLQNQFLNNNFKQRQSTSHNTTIDNTEDDTQSYKQQQKQQRSLDQINFNELNGWNNSQTNFRVNKKRKKKQ